MKPTPDDPLFRLHQIYPRLNENQLQELKDSMEEYAATCYVLFKRINNNRALMAQLDAKIAKRKKQQKRGK
jgi:hypothetical protein